MKKTTVRGFQFPMGMAKEKMKIIVVTIPGLVSIPYGNGKSSLLGASLKRSLSFNSLWEWQKVQDEKLISSQDLQVSIPYGNGKRGKYAFHKGLLSFQFPMGMAKGSYKYSLV